MFSCNRHDASIYGQPFRLGKGARVSNVDHGFWLSGVWVPVLVILGQVCVRAAKQAPQSSATDVFSFLVILDSAIFVERQKLLVSSASGSYENLLYFIYVSTIVSLIGWSFSQFLLEEKLIARHNRKLVKILGGSPGLSDRSKAIVLKNFVEEETLGSNFLLALFWLAAWAVSLTLFVLHIRLLAGRPLPWL